MLKKSALICIMACGIAPVQAHTSSEETPNPLVVAGATAIVVGTAVYMARRETNESKINRVHKLIDLYGVRIQGQLSQLMNNDDIRYFIAQSSASKKEIISMYNATAQLHKEMNNRYNSWVTPWNWTADMKQAFEAIKKLYQEALILKMMIDHAPLLQVDLGNDEALVKAARVFCAGISCYPVVHTIVRLQDDMQTLRSLKFYVPCEYMYIESLDSVVTALKSTDAYVQDRREQEKHWEQQRLASAAAQQASAQQAQAFAQMRQAAALEIRNDIERQK